MMEQTGAMITGTLIMLVFSGMLLLSVWKLIGSFSYFLYRLKLRKINLEDYHVFATDKGKPSILQHKSNPNKLIYL